jgi:hypothetical protein
MSVVKSSISILAVAAMLAGLPAVADTYVVAGPGVSLTDAAQAKFNRDSRPDDRYVKPVPGSSGISPHLYRSAGLSAEEAEGLTLEQVFIAKINRENGGDEQQAWMADTATSTSRGFGEATDYSQLALSAGLSREEAAGMSLADIAAAKLNSDH